jgi:threonylcarbamoyladenosine tRNA methylthiotransferase MtaB
MRQENQFSGDVLQDLAPLVQREERPVGAGPLRVAFWTLGCRLNQYDTEGIRSAMVQRYILEVVGWQEPADLYVLNSCTVTSKADQECRRLARQVKRRNPGAKVVVVGCYAQTQPGALAQVEEIDGVVGNTAKDQVETWLPEILGGENLTLKVAEFDKHPVFDSHLIDEFSGRSRAFVKIQDGCNLRCTYCLIWQARGPGRSRTPTDVLAQLDLLVQAGYRETILAGIHLGGYGRDLRPRTPLTDLLQRCLQAYPALRIRLSSIHPNEVTPALLDLFQQQERLRPHIHVSLQSGSTSVLQRMKRPYDGRRAWQAMREMAAARADLGIGADIIVGFPGETDEEFEETRRLVAENPFSYLHVFRFSPRPGTPAAEMPAQVHPETITERSAVLRELAERKLEEFSRSQLGKVREAIVEAESEVPGRLKATTDNYLTVHVPTGLEAGTQVRLAVAEYREDKLFGTVEDVLCHE